MTTPNGKVHVATHVDHDTHRQLKAAAKAAGQTMGDYVADLIVGKLTEPDHDDTVVADPMQSAGNEAQSVSQPTVDTLPDNLGGASTDDLDAGPGSEQASNFTTPTPASVGY